MKEISLRARKTPHEAYKEKIRPGKIGLQIKSVEKKSFLTDMHILMVTLATLVRT